MKFLTLILTLSYWYAFTSSQPNVNSIAYQGSDQVMIDQPCINAITVDIDEFIGTMHPIHYIGPIEDTVRLELWHTDRSKYSSSWYKHAEFNAKDLKVHIDTNSTLAIEDLEVERNRGFICSIPILLENIGSDTINIGYHTSVPIYTEVQDEKGHWHELISYEIACLSDVQSILLPPGHIAITSSSIFQDLKGKVIRYKFDNGTSTVYSKMTKGK